MMPGNRPGDAMVDCEVVRVDRMDGNLARVVLAPPEPLSARAGQFAMLRGTWSNDPLLGRPMSFLSAGETLEFLIRAEGRGSRLLTEVEPGGRVRLLGPLGRPFGQAEAASVVLVAGGCGLAPALFAAKEQAAAGKKPTFLYGARSREQLVLRDEVAAVADLRLSTDDGTLGHAGPVTDLLDEALGEASRAGPAEVWTCGPEPMMAAVARVTQRLGARCLVALEERMACGRGLCLGCAVVDVAGEPRYVCTDGPVFDARDIYGGRDG